MGRAGCTEQPPTAANRGRRRTWSTAGGCPASLVGLLNCYLSYVKWPPFDLGAGVVLFPFKTLQYLAVLLQLCSWMLVRKLQADTVFLCWIHTLF